MPNRILLPRRCQEGDSDESIFCFPSQRGSLRNQCAGQADSHRVFDHLVEGQKDFKPRDLCNALLPSWSLITSLQVLN